MFVGKLKVSEKNIRLEKPVKISYPMRDNHGPMDKNWVPFVKDNELYLIYSMSPFIVLKADLKTGICEEKTKKLQHYAWEHHFGEMRGGSPVAQIEKGEFLTFFHSSGFFPVPGNSGKNQRYYLMGALLIDADNEDKFEIKAMTEGPIVSEDLYGPNNKSGIIFVEGFIVHEKEIIISYGIADKKIGVAILDKEKLFSAMKRVSKK